MNHNEKQIHDSSKRIEIIEELYTRYGKGAGVNTLSYRIRFWRKKYAWLFVLGSLKIVKRSIDIIVSITMLIILAPLFLVVAMAIRSSDGGPVFFIQTRVGKWGREFLFYKFRSMVIDAEQLKTSIMDKSHHGNNSITFKMNKDPRITWIGRIIRKTSIDELPQLWNVLIGDLALVGPRPSLPIEVARYSLADRRRLDVTPGLTSTWAVSGRGDIPFQQQVKLDVQYIKSQSLWMDVKILLKTIPVVLMGKGAY